uniref:Uncharacterized protein n=1 Tax=Acrobeloides nanus TaxID=290746 RepID=A0A914BZ61_9BILA
MFLGINRNYVKTFCNANMIFADKAECYSGIKMMLVESFMPLAEQIKIDTTKCIEKVEPPAFQLGTNQITECMKRVVLIQPESYITINSTQACFSTYRKSMIKCDHLRDCCPAYTHCDMLMEIHHGLRAHERSLLEHFQCLTSDNTSEAREFRRTTSEAREFRRAPTRSSNDIVTTSSSTATPWTLPTLLPFPTLPTLPPPEKVFNDLANFFFPRLKVNMSDYISTTTIPLPSTTIAIQSEKDIRMLQAIEELRKRRKQKRTQLKSDLKSKLSQSGPVIIVTENHLRELPTLENKMQSFTNDSKIEQPLHANSTMVDDDPSIIQAKPMMSNSMEVNNDNISLSSDPDSTTSSFLITTPETLVANNSIDASFVLQKMFCTQAIECSDAVNSLYQICAERYDSATQLVNYEIPDHDMREIFLQNSKTNHTTIRQKCLQVLDADTQKQLLNMRANVTKENIECIRKTYDDPSSINNLVLAQKVHYLLKNYTATCSEIKLIPDIMELIKQSSKDDKMTSKECYRQVNRLKEKCQILRNCCPQITQCQQRGNSDLINYNEIIDQLKEEQTLCEQRRMRIFSSRHS